MLPRECFVYVVHATALTLFGIFFMHVQVRNQNESQLTICADSGDNASPPCQLSCPALVGCHTHNQVFFHPRHPFIPLSSRQDKPAVALAEGEEAQAEALLKIECKTNLESSTDTILFQVIKLVPPIFIVILHSLFIIFDQF